MSIPRITAGKNTIRFKVADAASVEGSIEIVYRYQTRSEETQQSNPSISQETWPCILSTLPALFAVIR